MSELEEVLESAVLRRRGQGYHDFEVGEVIRHHWGRTVTEADAIQFCHLTLAYNPLYFNREFACALGHPDVWLKQTRGDSRVAEDDILDALALCWSAARLARRCHGTLPAGAAPKDRRGLSMEMVF